MTPVLMLVLLATSPASTSASISDPPVERKDDRTVAIGAGLALDLNSSLAAGGAAFVEYAAVNEVLELELGGQIIGTSDGRELSLDLIGKWPYQLTSRLEIMLGIGPTIVTVRGARNSTAWGIQGAVDVMWWPAHQLGFWVSPTYEVLFRKGLSGAFGGTLGPMIGW